MFDRIDPDLLPFIDSESRQLLQNGQLAVDDHQALLDEARRLREIWLATLKPTREQILAVAHQTDRDHVAMGGSNEQHWKALEAGWYRAQKPTAEDAAKARYPTPEQPKDPSPSGGVRVHGSRRSPTEAERVEGELLRFMPQQVRTEYKQADAEQKAMLWEANRRAFEAAKKRKAERLLREQEVMEKALDMLQRIKEDAGKAHLLPPEDVSRADLLKWYEKMSRPARNNIPFPDGSLGDTHLSNAVHIRAEVDEFERRRKEKQQEKRQPPSQPLDVSASPHATDRKPNLSWTKIIGGIVVAFVALVFGIGSAYQNAGVVDVTTAHVLIALGWAGFMASIAFADYHLPLSRRRKLVLLLLAGLVSAVFAGGADLRMVRLKAQQAPAPKVLTNKE